MPKTVKIKCTRWVCGVCKKKQRTEGVKCLDCFAPKHRGISLVVLHGDWCCLNCGINNFAKRKLCFSCGKLKKSNRSVFGQIITID